MNNRRITFLLNKEVDKKVIEFIDSIKKHGRKVMVSLILEHYLKNEEKEEYDYINHIRNQFCKDEFRKKLRTSLNQEIDDESQAQESNIPAIDDPQPKASNDIPKINDKPEASNDIPEIDESKKEKIRNNLKKLKKMKEAKEAKEDTKKENEENY